jgi:Raf kinase inhibitor-like YbhB/YbcL family protein
MELPLRLLALLFAVTLGAAGCADSDQDEPVGLPENLDVLEVSSPDLEDGGEFPADFTCDGDNVSPALRWTQAKNTDEYIIVMNDPDARGGEFVHWKLFSIDPQRSSVGRSEVPGEAVEGINAFGDTGYAGPCPPEGEEAHTYEISVYALNRSLELAPDASLRELLDQINCCLEASGTMEVSYAR